DAGYPERVQSDLRALRVLKHSTPGFTSSSFISIPYDVFPRIPGLFPWDWIGRDCVLCWHMVREGEDSPQVVLVDEGERRVVELPGDMVDCITDIITGRYPEFDYIAEEFDPPRFVPLKLPPADSNRAPRRTSDHADLDPSGLLTVPLSKADAVSELLQLRGAAASPRTVDWPALERHLRHPLPADYKRFMELVGPGTYGDITVADPADSGDTPSLLDLTREALD